jgi:hypothetical protein
VIGYLYFNNACDWFRLPIREPDARGVSAEDGVHGELLLADYIIIMPVIGLGCQSESLMHEKSVLRMVSMESCDWLLIL